MVASRVNMTYYSWSINHYRKTTRQLWHPFRQSRWQKVGRGSPLHLTYSYSEMCWCTALTPVTCLQSGHVKILEWPEFNAQHLVWWESKARSKQNSLLCPSDLNTKMEVFGKPVTPETNLDFTWLVLVRRVFQLSLWQVSTILPSGLPRTSTIVAESGHITASPTVPKAKIHNCVQKKKLQ